MTGPTGDRIFGPYCHAGFLAQLHEVGYTFADDFVVPPGVQVVVSPAMPDNQIVFVTAGGSVHTIIIDDDEDWANVAEKEE